MFDLKESTPEREKWEEYQTVLWKKLDGKMPKVLRNVFFDPNKEDLIYLNEVLEDLREYRNCYSSGGKENSTMPPNKKDSKGKMTENSYKVWNNQIRCINYLAETKVTKIPHNRKELEGWLTETYT
ncbi:275_t:CDS:2 [Gigaspora margarita]|uniref:275_t:CDS:1 n=1 Tax=Gigaspora margarita TaxID=4874 RepID=A0ABN7UZT1_GIGMA|nr:275_t:CDS:2 [Gigaspora margarita]